MDKGQAATVLLDLHKYYETTGLRKQLFRCKQFELPSAIARVAICMYLQSRWFRLAGFTDGPFRAASGVIAGCGFATTLIR
eukprot:4177285-Pyramimonas_sp.AAC.1